MMGYRHNVMKHITLYDRVKKLLVSYDWSDCSFSVAGKDFKAHKLILGTSSPVFEAMFYGPLSTNDNVIITDIEPETFQLLLNYIYTDNIEISCIDEAFELLYASRKYILEHLYETCVEYIQANISIDNVMTVLNYPDYLQDVRLNSFALKLFCEHAEYLLKENKSVITPSCLKSILQSDQINVCEKKLIKHVFEWTLYYCKQNNIPADVKRRRDILIDNGLLKLLRFSTLSEADLNDIFEDNSNLLLPKEFEYLLRAVGNNWNENNSDEIYAIAQTGLIRSCIKLQWYLCHRSSLRPVSPVVIDLNNVLVQSRIKANKSAFVKSLCVPTKMAPLLNFHNNPAKLYSEEFSVSIVCESNNSIISYTNFMNTVKYDSIIDIELNSPFFIKKNEWYKISFEWPRNGSHICTYVVEYRERMYDDQRIMFEFDDLYRHSGSVGSFLVGLKFCL